MDLGRNQRVTLMCLPYAGGSASVFRDWAPLLPSWIELAALPLPGRGTHYRTHLIHDWRELCAWLVDESASHRRGPFALFGHSMGALLALELAHTLCAERDETAGPIWLGVSACAAPPRHEADGAWLDAPRDRVVARLRELGGTPVEVLENDDLVEMALPVLRNDFHLCGTYRPTPRPPLACPLLALGGTDDPISTPRDNLTDWVRETSGPMNVVEIEGGHFFLNDQRPAVLSAVIRSLGQVVFPTSVSRESSPT